ncbi:MAG: toxin-antitoxin system YwqK family antitoxin, partial [Salibacteraceae bacterium]
MRHLYTLLCASLLTVSVAFGQSTTHYANGQVKQSTETPASCSCKWITNYHENGQIAERYRVLLNNNQRDGEYLSFFENGKQEKVMQWKNGVLDGPQKAYYLNGTLRSSTHYLKGKKSGEWQFFNEKGELESTETNEGDLTVRTFYYQGKVYRIEQ